MLRRRSVHASIRRRVSCSQQERWPLRLSPLKPLPQLARDGRRETGPPGSGVCYTPDNPAPVHAHGPPVQVFAGPGSGRELMTRFPARSCPAARPGPGPRTPSPRNGIDQKHTRGSRGARFSPRRKPSNRCEAWDWWSGIRRADAGWVAELAPLHHRSFRRRPGSRRLTPPGISRESGLRPAPE